MLLLRVPRADNTRVPSTDASSLGEARQPQVGFCPGAGREAPSVPPAVRARRGERPAASPGAAAPGAAPPGSAAPAPAPAFSGAAAALEMNIYISWKSAARHRREAGRRLEPELVILPECEWARPAALGSGVLSFCFIRLSIGFGKETQSSPIAQYHMENLRYFDYALCKHFNIGSLKSRGYPKGD